MIGKKINQLATELAPESTDLTIIGDPTTGVSKKITLAQLGAIFSGAVSFYNDLASFPVSGDINVIYCAKDSQKLYLWSGSAYVEVFPSQALLDTYQLRSEKGNANGYASLDSGGKVPISQLPSSIMEYKGTWNAATNTPTLANGTGDTGDVYICNVAGTVNFGAGPITFAVGDYVIYSGTIWQRSSGAVGTVTSVAASITGDSITISGSPVTTSGTLAFAFNGTTAQYIRGNGTLETFPSLTGFVPYTGATANVDLGTHTLLAAKGIFSSSGSGDTVGITHSSGSGIALNITKGGNGEGLYINKTSGSGNAATIIGTLNATSLVKSGGTSSQFLKADGSVDSSTYLTTSDASSLYLPLTGGTLTGLLSINSALRIKSGAANGVLLETYNTNQLVVRVTPSSTTYDSTLIFPSNSRNYTFPDASGTLALVGGSGVGTVTSVAALTIGTSGTDLSSTVANGTTTPVITLNVPTASATNRGALSSTDWTTFNNKQNALTNPITGISASGRVAYFNGDTSITGSSNFFWDSTNNRLGIGLNNPQRTLEIHNATADSQLRISGAAPSVSLGEAITGAIYQAKFGLITANGQYVTGGVAGDFVMISQTGATIFATSSTEKMRVQASGNVSIGNTNDTFKLDVSGTGRFTGALTGTSATFSGAGVDVFSSSGIGTSAVSGLFRVVTGGTGSGIAIGQSNSTRYTSILANEHIIYNDDFFMRTNGAFPLVLGTNNTPRLTIASTGAATFSSTVTATGYNVANTGGSIQTVDAGAYVSLFGATGSPANTLIFGTNNAPRMTISSTGNLGLGVTPSAWGLLTALQVKNAFVAGANDNSYFGANTYYDGNSFTYRYINSNFANVYTQQSGQHQWLTAPSGTAGNAISFTQAMTLNASGNLGIGETNPTSRLHIQSSASGGQNLRIQTSVAAGRNYIQFANGSGDMGYIGYGGADSKFWINNQLNDDMLFVNNGATRLTIASTGAATFSSSVTAYGPANDWGLSIWGSTTTGQSYGGIVRGGTNSSDVAFKVNNAANTIPYFNIRGDGYVGIGTANPTGTYGKLSVAGGISILDDNNAKLEIGRYSSGASNSYIKLGANSNSLRITNKNDTADIFTIENGGNVEIAIGSIKTGEPDTGYGRAAIKIGARNTGEAFNSGGHLPVNIDGTIYFINVYSSLP